MSGRCLGGLGEDGFVGRGGSIGRNRPQKDLSVSQLRMGQVVDALSAAVSEARSRTCAP